MEDRTHIVTFGEVWEQKRQEMGQGDMSDAAWSEAFGEIEDGTTLAVRIFTALAAWIAASAFIGLLGLLGWINSEESAMAWGMIFTVAFMLLPLVEKLPPMMEPFFMAIGIIGQLMLGFTIVDKWGVLPVCLSSVLIETVLLITTKSVIQRFISTVLLFLTGLGLIHYVKAYELTHAYVGVFALILAYFWVNEPRVLAHKSYASKYMEPVGTGLAVSLVFLLMITVNRDFYEEFISYWWASTLFIGLGIIYVARHILRAYQVEQYQFLAYASIAVALLPTVLAPGIACSMLLILLGFYRGQPIISTLGALALVIFVSFFYYNLQATLLVKSIALMASGFVMVMVRIGLKKMVTNG